MNLKVNGLTTNTQKEHTMGGGIFMAEEGQGGQASISTQEGKINSPVQSETRPMSPFTKSADQIKNPELRKFAKEFELRVQRKPLDEWGTEKLKAEYLNWQSFASSLEQKEGFTEKIAIEAQPYEMLVIRELERRGVDLRELFLEAARKAGKEGKALRSIGAAKADIPMLDYTEPILQNIVIEIYNEIDRVGDGSALDPQFVRDKLQEVRNIRNADPNNGPLVEQANRLLTNLNTWMEESMVAAGEERRTSYFSAREVSLIRTDSRERERIFEEIFLGVDANPGKEFHRAQSLQDATNFSDFFRILNEAEIRDSSGDTITDPIVLSRERGKLHREFSARGEIRTSLHNANWSVSGGGDIQAFANAVTEYKAEYTDLVFSDPLVGTALHMFEQAFQKIKADNNGMLPYEKLEWNYKTESSGLEDIVWDEMTRALASRAVKEKVTDEHGNIRMRPVNEEEEIPPWRLQRAITLARGFGVLSLRFPEIAAEARLPEERPGISAEARARRIASIYGEAIARYLDPLEHAIEKYSIGGPERALLYFFLTGDKGQFQSTKQIKEALEMRSHLTGEDKRLIDIINIFRTGGPFSYSSWRVFTAMEGVSQDQLRRSGIGMREARVSGDVDDAILEEVRTGPTWAGRSDKDIAAEATRRSNQAMPGEERITYKDYLILQRRIAMWEDALKVNPLRVMWMLESREPGQRIKFISEALGIPMVGNEDRLKEILNEVEKNLMVVQEEFVSSGKSIEAEGELSFSIIAVDSQRDRVTRYVNKIREKGIENNHHLIRQLFKKTPAEGSPFPFIIGMEDIPFSDFNFINTGGRAFARRIDDLSGAIRAANELIGLITKFPTSQNIGPIIESLVKIKDGISFYDRSLAMEILPYLEEGILRIYDKEVLARLPLGIGTIVGLLKDTSYAQEVLGRAAMSWDEGDKYSFTRQLLQNGLIEKNKLEDLRRRVGATAWHAGIDILRTYGQFVLLILAFEFVNRVAKRNSQ